MVSRGLLFGFCCLAGRYWAVLPPDLQLQRGPSPFLLVTSVLLVSCLSFKGSFLAFQVFWENLCLASVLFGQASVFRTLIFHLGIHVRACVFVASAAQVFVLTKILEGLCPFCLLKSWAVSLNTGGWGLEILLEQCWHFLDEALGLREGEGLPKSTVR